MLLEQQQQQQHIFLFLPVSSDNCDNIEKKKEK